MDTLLKYLYNLEDMKKYELMTIIKASLNEEDAGKVAKSVKDLISSLNGNVVDTLVWGKRKFSYKINNEKEGFYEVTQFEVDPQNMPKFKGKLNLIDGLVRYLILAQ